MKRFASFSIVLLFSFSVFATDTRPAFDALKGKPVDYTPIGQICEQVARLQLAEEFGANQFNINVGVEYAVNNRTVGELDIVITEKASQQVVVVGEVKCWKDMSGGLRKAREQRARFQRTLKTQPREIVFGAKEGGKFSSDQFQETKYIAIAQSGSKSAGYDVDLVYTLDELMQLRSQLMQCQSDGECPTE